MRWWLKKKRQNLIRIEKMIKTAHINGGENLRIVIVGRPVVNRVTGRVQEIEI